MIRRVLGAAITTIVVAAALALASWFVFAAVSGATLLTFRTGSMAPTMPQGAVAVSLPVAADELRPGDVVTVQRPGAALPVTHRVVEVRVPATTNDAERSADDGAASDPRARELVLQGDANQTPDARPYIVSEVRRVVASAPHLGSALMLLQSPIGMGVLTLLAGVLATWAFWPGRADPAAADATGTESEQELGPEPGAARGTARQQASP